MEGPAHTAEADGTVTDRRFAQWVLAGFLITVTAVFIVLMINPQ